MLSGRYVEKFTRTNTSIRYIREKDRKKKEKERERERQKH